MVDVPFRTLPGCVKGAFVTFSKQKIIPAKASYPVVKWKAASVVVPLKSARLVVTKQVTTVVPPTRVLAAVTQQGKSVRVLPSHMSTVLPSRLVAGVTPQGKTIRVMPRQSSLFKPQLVQSKMFASDFDYTPKHPLTGESARGLRGNEEKIPWTQYMSRKQYLIQGEADTQAFIFNAVNSNTKGVYASAQKPYIRFCHFMGTNPLLNIIPPEWYETSPHPHSFKITILSNYLSYLVNDNEGKTVSASSSGNYLSAARKLMEDSGQCVAFMKDNPVLRAVKKGIKNEWVAIPGHSTAETSLYSVSIDMIEHAAKELLRVEDSLEDLGVLTQQVIAYGHINRSSETIWCPKTKHHLKTEMVHFYLMPNEGEVYSGVFPKNPLEVSADMMDSYPDERVAGHNLFLIDSKTDKYGSGHPNPGVRQLVLPSTAVYDMTSTLLHWYRKAYPLRGEPFLSSSRPNNKFYIVRAHLNRFHHGLAELYGLDPSRVNTHSTRFGGASAMKAAGFSDATIMFMGRWSSLCFLRYIRESIKTRYQVAKALATRDTFTIEDSRLMSSSSAYRL